MANQLFPLLLTALYAATLSSAYAIDIAFTTTLTIHHTQVATAAASAAASTAVTFTLHPTAKSKPSCSSPPTSTLDPKAPFTNTTDTGSFPALPLSRNQAFALSDFLNLIDNIPENLLEAGETGVENFFKNVSSCFDTGGKKGISSALGVVTKASSIAGVVESKITSAAAPIITKASSVASEIEGKITSAAQPVVSKVSSIANEVENGISSILHGFPIHFRDSRPLVKDNVLDDIFDTAKCLGTAITSNPIFDVGKCAFDIASLVPASGPAVLAKLVNIRKLVKDVGGLAKVLAGLGKAGSRADALRVGGNALVQLVEEVSGVGDLVQDCKFLVQ